MPKSIRKSLEQSCSVAPAKRPKAKAEHRFRRVKTATNPVNATDKCGHNANRELSKLIEKAMRSVKKSDKGGQHFVLGWRLYPNKDHARWKNKDVHSCGCGCGCSA